MKPSVLSPKPATIQTLKSLIKELRNSAEDPQQPFWFRSLVRSNDTKRFALNNAQAETYLSFLDELAPDTGQPQLRSRASIDEALAKCVLLALDSKGESDVIFEERLEKAIADLQMDLKSDLIKWEVWRFFRRINVPSEGFQFGKAFFCDKSHECVKPRVDSIVQTIESLKDFDAINKPTWPTSLDAVALCKVTVDAVDLDAALDQADFELNATFQALNFFASLVYLTSRLPALSRHRNNAPEAELLCFFSSKVHGSKWVGLRFMDTFDPRKMTKDKDIELSFRKASELFGNSTDNLESRVQSAIKWAGKASVTQNRENAFVFYSIALEALLLGQQRQEQLAYKLRLRAAHLLGFSNVARSDIRNRVNKLYGIRSKIVHSGTMEIAQSDLDELRIITQSCIVCILAHPNFQNIYSETELENWFEERLIYGPENC